MNSNQRQGISFVEFCKIGYFPQKSFFSYQKSVSLFKLLERYRISNHLNANYFKNMFLDLSFFVFIFCCCCCERLIFIESAHFFLSYQVLCQGQIIGAIVAETQVQAQRAAKCVKVQYEELEPIITIQVYIL